MPLTAIDISIGAIAFLDERDLVSPDVEAHIRVGGVADPDPKEARPFICYAMSGSMRFGIQSVMTYWAPLTGTAKRERLVIRPEWIANPYGKLHDPIYLQDGARTFSGPAAIFVRASEQSETRIAIRPTIVPLGVAAVVDEVRAQGGSMPK